MVRKIYSAHPRFAGICRGTLAGLKPAAFLIATMLALLGGIVQRAWAAPPTTFTVTVTTDTTSGTTSNCNQTQGGAMPNFNCSLRDAIAAATAAGGSTVVNFDSTLTTGGAATITLNNGALVISTNLTIAGPGASLLAISGNNATVFNINSGTVTISGLTVANGGGDISPSGAIFNSATLTVNDSTFSNNSTGGHGGGIYNGSSGTLTVSGSTFSGNRAYIGGGIYNAGTMTVSNSTFSDNSAAGIASGGGGIANGGTLTVRNSTFSDNGIAGYFGGGIYNGGGTLTVGNSIFSGNSAFNPDGGGGGGIYNYSGATANASYNVFYNNTDNSGEADCTGCTSNTNATDADPKLDSLGNYGGTTQTMLPLPGSAAICAGSAALVPTGLATDQRGFPLKPSCVDAGAVQTNYLMVTTTTDSNDGSCTSSTCSLRDAITQANIDTMRDISFRSSVTGTITLTTSLSTLTGQINIIGPGATLLTVSDRDDGVFIVGNDYNTGPVSISGLTFANTGYSVGPSGAIFNNKPATLTVSNCTFSNNSTEYGGGGISNASTLAVIDSTFSGNYGGQGGGGINNGGTLTVSNTTFSGNSGTGGGINNSGTLTVSNSSFSGNSGSAIYNSNPIYKGSATMTASNNIFSGNPGGGISNNGAIANASYNIFYNNTASGSEADCTGCTSNTNATDADPKLAPLSDYGGPTPTMLPLPGSAAICAGSTALVPSGLATDQRGFPRLNSTYTGSPCVDAGAVESSYQSVQFANVQFTNAGNGYFAVVNQTVSPAPIVSVTENGQNIGGVPVTLAFIGTGKATGLGPATTAAGTGATFASVSVNEVGNDFLKVTLQITPSYALAEDFANLTITLLNAISFTPPTSPVNYGVAPITLVATATSGLPVTFTVLSGPATISDNILTITGTGTIVIAANQGGNINYPAATQVTHSIIVNPASQTISFTAPTSPVIYGVAPVTLAATATSGLAVPFTVLSGPATLSGGILTITGAGTVVVAANQAGNSNYAAATQVTHSITVNPQATSSTLTSSAATIAAGQPLTLTAKVGPASSGTPSGTVTFLDGKTILSTATLAKGTASYSTAMLATGSHTLMATYSGDSNYAASSSSASVVTVAMPDFTVTGSGTTTQTVSPGATATYSIALAPANGVYPGPVTFAVTGLPIGAIATFSPSTLAANAGAQTVTLKVQTAGTSASNVWPNSCPRSRGMTFETAGVSLAMLLLPLALPRRLKRTRTTLARHVMIFLFLLGGVAGMAGLSGCGGSSFSSSTGQSPPQGYNLVVTVTSGAVQHNFDLTLTVE
jgi:CSLREA domain-containing protein